MLNGGCKFLPCHEGLQDCNFCFCPIYPCGNLEYGKWLVHRPSTYESERVWDCSQCTVFHKKENIEKVKEFMREMIDEGN